MYVLSFWWYHFNRTRLSTFYFYLYFFIFFWRWLFLYFTFSLFNQNINFIFYFNQSINLIVIRAFWYQIFINFLFLWLKTFFLLFVFYCFCLNFFNFKFDVFTSINKILSSFISVVILYKIKYCTPSWFLLVAKLVDVEAEIGYYWLAELPVFQYFV